MKLVVSVVPCAVEAADRANIPKDAYKHSDIVPLVAIHRFLERREDQLSPSTLQRHNAKNLKQIFPEKEYRGLSPNFHIHVSVTELYISTMGLPFLLEEICGPILGLYKSLTDT
jgi:hypothetical protein